MINRNAIERKIKLEILSLDRNMLKELKDENYLYTATGQWSTRKEWTASIENLEKILFHIELMKIFRKECDRVDEWSMNLEGVLKLDYELADKMINFLEAGYTDRKFIY